MPLRLLHLKLGRFGRALSRAYRTHGQRAMQATVCTPAFAETPLTVDATMMSGVAALVLFVGVSVGLLYRHMKAKEEQLSKRVVDAESELRALLTMTDEAVLVMSSDGIVRQVNPGAEELFLQDAAGLVGRRIFDLLPHHLPLAELTRHGPATFSVETPQPDGRKLPLDVFLSQVALAEGTSYLIVAHPGAEVAADVLSKPVRQACHDLNNHFTTLLGTLSLVLMSGDVSASNKERILNAKKAGLRAQQTVRRLHCLAAGEDPDAVEETPSTIVPMPMPLPQPAGTLIMSDQARVLVLDDEEAIRLLVAEALDSAGFAVTTTGDGESAVAICDEAFKAGRPFRVVVSDLCLPGKLDGRDAVLKMREIDPSLQAIVSSGHDTDSIMRGHRQHGFAAALQKPFDVGTLIRMVGDLISADQPVRRSA